MTFSLIKWSVKNIVSCIGLGRVTQNGPMGNSGALKSMMNQFDDILTSKFQVNVDRHLG